MQLYEGSFDITSRTPIAVTNDTLSLGETLRDYLKPATGFSLPIVRRPGNGAIVLRLDKKLTKLGDEGYDLKVDDRHVEIDALNPAGVFYGIQTLRQLLPIQIFRAATVADQEWTVPAINIEDIPRFAWRGCHLDVARHFMPKGFVMKFLDLMALHKLNTFHWHLTDDQGWRIEIKKYPALTTVGAYRKDSMLTYNPPTFEGKPHSGFYTQDDIREVVAYAAKRFITVVPEIEMPGHSQAAIAAYPDLGNSHKACEVPTTWGVIEDVFNVEDSTVAFLQDVLTEVCALFPSKFIHIGGDEVPKKQWHASAEAQELMKQRGLKDEDELQSWFIHQMDAFLTAKGRRLIGWDEILEGGLAPGATVMSWRGEAGGVAAAKAGHDVVMAPSRWTYFDHYQCKDHSKEPHAIGGYLPLQDVYSYEPIPSELSPDEAKHVLGAQAQIWTEYIPNPRQVEYMAYPRLCALAEVVWSPKESRNYQDFQRRLEIHLQRLQILGVNFRQPQEGD